MEKISTSGLDITILGNGETNVIALTDSGFAEKILSLLYSESESVASSVCISAVSGVNWDDDLTPWKAPGLRGAEFGGKADGFLSRLTDGVIPALKRERRFNGKPYIIGYSLAGLFSLYAVTKSAEFRGAASVSGSLWYDRFTEYFQNADILTENVYFSLGGAESHSRSSRLAAVGDATETAYELVRSRGIRTTFVMNRGGHFTEPEKRCADAVRWLVGASR